MGHYSVYAQQFWDILTGVYPTRAAQEIPIIASLGYYAFTIFLSRILRGLNKQYAPSRIRPYVADLIMSFTICGCSLENGMIRNNFGMTGYAIIIFTTTMWFYCTVDEGCANPCSNAIKYTSKLMSATEACARTVIQLVGALLSFHYARLFWYLELTEGHGLRYRTLHCNSDLRVAWPVGFGIEFSATVLDTVLCLSTFTPFCVFEMASKVVFGIFVVIAGLNMTGMYLNPVNASNQTFGCYGTGVVEHLFVYWVGPLFGAACAVKIHEYFIDYGKSMKEKFKQDLDNTALKENGAVYDSNDNKAVSVTQNEASNDVPDDSEHISTRLRQRKVQNNNNNNTLSGKKKKVPTATLR